MQQAAASSPFLPAQVDVLVFGSGAGGLTAALVASIEGLGVLVFEKTDLVGGTTATSGGTIWAPGAPPIARAGGKATPEDARRYLKEELGEWFDTPLVDAFLASSPEAVAYLEKHSEVRFDHTRNPDYHVETPGGSATRHAMTASAFDARELGAEFARLRAPRSVFLKDRKSNGLSGKYGCRRVQPSIADFGPACVAIDGKEPQMGPQALPDAWRVAAGGHSPCIRHEPPPLRLPSDALIDLDLRCVLG